MMFDVAITPQLAVQKWRDMGVIRTYKHGKISGLRIDRGKDCGIAVIDRMTLNFALGDAFMTACDKITMTDKEAV